MYNQQGCVNYLYPCCNGQIIQKIVHVTICVNYEMRRTFFYAEWQQANQKCALLYWTTKLYVDVLNNNIIQDGIKYSWHISVTIGYNISLCTKNNSSLSFVKIKTLWIADLIFKIWRTNYIATQMSYPKNVVWLQTCIYQHRNLFGYKLVSTSIET